MSEMQRARPQREEAMRFCEAIAARDRSSLYQVSQYLRDRRRYEAFIAMYAVMRVIDDLVDGIPDVRGLTEAQRGRFDAELSRWEHRIAAACAGTPGPGPLDAALAEATSAFPVPPRIWAEFLEAMRYDLRHDRFETSGEFLAYAQGATAAPTTIFVYLLTADREQRQDPMNADGGAGKERERDARARGGPVEESPGPARYTVKERGDGFDYATCGRDLGIFAYIAHILRDVASDLRLGRRGRLYIPESDLIEAGLSEADVRAAVSSGRGGRRWRDLVALLARRARDFEESGVRMAMRRLQAMEQDCRFILLLIVRMYQHLLGAIETDPERVLREAPLQTESDRRALLARAAEEAGYSLSPAAPPRPAGADAPSGSADSR